MHKIVNFRIVYFCIQNSHIKYTKICTVKMSLYNTVLYFYYVFEIESFVHMQPCEALIARTDEIIASLKVSPELSGFVYYTCAYIHVYTF